MSLIKARSFLSRALQLYQTKVARNLSRTIHTIHDKNIITIKFQNQNHFNNISRNNLTTTNSLFSNESIITNPIEKQITDDIKDDKIKRKQRIEIKLNEQDLIESFVKGSGNGGQKINTSSNCVDLRHVPTGMRVQCQKTRSLQQNRNIARKILIERLDNYYNGELKDLEVEKNNQN
ncbi:8251_t:CDS:2 [Funneliformis caledonium]|uniref:8251_t:CDS:1 n=1 Tax=Funneliformis caledonium TaxID=1117310 RepID=A0A9N9AZ86_9GLOM|nr:8251_t:CDS:2 [Funneliformis caledonium]